MRNPVLRHSIVSSSPFSSFSEVSLCCNVWMICSIVQYFSLSTISPLIQMISIRFIKERDKWYAPTSHENQNQHLHTFSQSNFVGLCTMYNVHSYYAYLDAYWGCGLFKIYFPCGIRKMFYSEWLQQLFGSGVVLSFGVDDDWFKYSNIYWLKFSRLLSFLFRWTGEYKVQKTFSYAINVSLVGHCSATGSLMHEFSIDHINIFSVDYILYFRTSEPFRKCHSGSAISY